MTDELGEQFRISVLIVFMGALLTAAIIVLIFSLDVLQEQGGRYNTAIHVSATSSIKDLQNQRYVSCPQAYASIVEAGDEIREVIYHTSDTDTLGRTIYTYKQVDNDLLFLLTTEQTRTNVKVRIEREPSNTPPLVIVHITKVKDVIVN